MITEDFREEWQTMPNEDLRNIYSSLVRRQRLFSRITWLFLPPAILIYGVLGWGAFFGMEMSGFQSSPSTGVGAFLYYVAFACAGLMMLGAKPPKHWAICLVMPAAGLLVELIYDVVSPEPLAMEVFIIYACFRLQKICTDIEFLRGLPSFPFDSRRAEQNMSGMNRSDILKELNMTHTGIQNIDMEKIFTADHPEEIASPREKTEEYFQQHKMPYGRK